MVGPIPFEGTRFALPCHEKAGRQFIMASVTKEIIVNAPVSKVFEIWKDFENFPRFMENIESIDVTGPNTTHWKMKGPLSTSVEWDAETLTIQENEKISWKSTGGTIETHGAVLFESIEIDRTRVTVGLEYNPPGGALGEAVAKLFNDPETQLEEDLMRFKKVAQGDSEDVVTTASSSGAIVDGVDHTGGG
ncbi:SRPBCC family protein [bacterium]|nr:MAG: SRPBCC family protein [bacterium]